MFRNRIRKKSTKSYEDIQYSCTVRFLDDSEPISLIFQKETKGQNLLNNVCEELNLIETDYFGLRYVDIDKQRHWLDPVKPVYKQLKNVNPIVLCFRVKFYPTEPMKVKEEITRYFLFLQLRRDLHHGRLLCSPVDANMLAAYIIQSELGDYEEMDHPEGYVAQFKMLPKQTQKQEEKIAEIHKTLVGEVPAEAETNFLKKASNLDTYGVDPHPVKPKMDAKAHSRDQKMNQMYLGVTHLGIVTFQGNKRTHLFKWPQINKIAFEGKMFIVHVTVNEGDKPSLFMKRKKHACGFKCPTYLACKHLWKCAVEQQYFFTLQKSEAAPKVTSGGGVFTRGSKFRFSGRCQREVYADSVNIDRDQPAFTRSSSNPCFPRSFNANSTSTLPGRLTDKSMNDVTSSTLSDLNLSLFSGTLLMSSPIPEELSEGREEETAAGEGEATGEGEEGEEEGGTEPAGERGIDCPDSEAPVALPADQPPAYSADDLEPASRDDLDPAAEVKSKRELENHVPPPPPSLSVTPPARSEPAAPPGRLVAPPGGEAGRRRAAGRVVLRTLLVAVLLTIALVILFEPTLDFAALDGVRHTAEVDRLRREHYEPMRAAVLRTVGRVFGK